MTSNVSRASPQAPRQPPFAVSLILQAYQMFRAPSLNRIDPLSGGTKSTADPSPEKVNRHASEHDQNSNARSGRREPGKIDNNQTGQDDRHDRYDRITPGSVRPFGLRFFTAQYYHRRNEQKVKEQIGRDNVFEQLCVNISVNDRSSSRICRHRSRQG